MMSSVHPASRLLILLGAGVGLTALVLSGCKPPSRADPSASGDETIDTAALLALEDEPAGEPIPHYAPAEVSPVIRPVASEGQAPRAVVVQLARDVVRADRVGEVIGPETKVVIEPAVAGEVRFTSPSTLRFTPEEGFLPGTKYTFRVEALESAAGVIEAGGDAWSTTFRTPDLRFLRAVPVRFDRRRDTMVADLVFSGPVAGTPDDIAALVSLKHGERLLPGGAAKFTRPSDRNVVRMTVQHALVQSPGELRVSVDSGLTSAVVASARATGGSDRVLIDPTAKVAEVESVHLVETSSGWFVEVICDDDAAEGYDRWFWNRNIERGFYVSQRCTLSDDVAREAIHITPEVDWTLSPTRGGFRLEGDFERGVYNVRIDGGAKTVDGGTFLTSSETDLVIGPLEPTVQFTSKGRYLPKKAWKGLPVRHRNVDGIDLTVRRVPRQNLQFWLSGEVETADARTSDVVLKEKIPVKSTVDTVATTWLDVENLLPAEKQGVYELTVESGGARDVSRILLTDMNLIVKAHQTLPDQKWPRKIHVWALGMTTNNSLRDVKVQAVRPSGKALASCSTDTTGGCLLELPSSEGDIDGTAPFAIVATKGLDTTYLKFDELKTSVAEEHVSGEPYVSERVYRASMYTDRGVYRPGDSAHLSAVVRNRTNQAPKEALPVELQLLDPRSKLVKKLTVQTNAAGMFSVDLPFADYATTGRYEAQLFIGKRKIGDASFNVEEFVPERMRVEASTAAAAYLDSDRVPVKVDAQYLFGGSASDSRFEVACRLMPDVFKPKNNAQLSYGMVHDEAQTPRPVTLGTVSGVLGDDGSGELACPSTSASFATGGKLVADVSVFEAGSGRTTRGSVSVPVHPDAFYVGLAASEQKVEGGKPFSVQGTVVDWNGDLAASAVDKVEVELFRMESEWGWIWDDESEDERYSRYLRKIPDGRQEVEVKGGRFTVTATPGGDAARYLVVVKAGKTRTEILMQGTGDSYWWRPTESAMDVTPRPLKPTSVALELPEEIAVGAEVPVTFTAPFRGRALLTVETNQVLTTRWVDVEPGPQEWRFELADFAPNVYVSAFVVKDPQLDSAQSFMPDRAFGVRSTRVKPEAFTQALALDVPKEVRSNSKLKVKLALADLDPGTFVTVAAVDEGILSLTKFPSPEPRDDLFPVRALGVETFETVGWAMHMPAMGPSSHTGGDGDMGDPGRVQMVKPVALWSGLLEVPKDGLLEVELDVPQYRGALRVMAVAAGPTRVGAATAQVIVRDPLVLQTTLPRFLVSGDEAEIPVFLTNASGAPQTVDLSMTGAALSSKALASARESQQIVFLGDSKARITLKDGESRTSVFRVKAVGTLGAARFHVVARAGSLISEEELEVPFAANGPRTREVEQITLASGNLDLRSHVGGWLPGSERTTFWVTNNPYGRSFQHLKYLVRYPYGCIEQTTSSTRPLLFVSNLLPAIDPELASRDEVDTMVMSGVNRLISMQTPSGGFAYWPGGTEPTLWGSAYATHLLIDAQEKGYPIPSESVEDAVDFIQTELDRGKDEYYYGHVYAYGEPYLQYVLARAGKGRKGRIQALINDLGAVKDTEADEQRYLLKAALFLSGDRRYERDLQHPDVSPLTGERRNSWSFYSDLRKRGFILGIYQDLFGAEGAGGEKLAKLVGQGLEANRASRWYTTQELVWGITGLGKWVDSSAKTWKAPTLLANGKPLTSVQQAIGAEGKSNDRSWSLAFASEYTSLDLKVDEVGEGKVYLVVNSEGVKEGASWTYGGSGLRLTREYLDLEGNALDPGAHSLGDLVYTRITIENTRREKVQNIALVDRFPAGWEIENPRLGRGSSIDWLDVDNLWTVDHANLRDDRMEVFGSLDAGETREVVYQVRAVTAGSFTAPPVEAEAMYDPAIWARAPGGPVVIEGPWEGLYL